MNTTPYVSNPTYKNHSKVSVGYHKEHGLGIR